MNLFTRTAAVLFASAGLALTVAPLAGAATTSTAPSAAVGAVPADYGDPGEDHWGHEHWGHEHWRDGYWSDDKCDRTYHYYEGVWSNHCVVVPAAAQVSAPAPA
jgi:hypothetical protein